MHSALSTLFSLASSISCPLDIERIVFTHSDDCLYELSVQVGVEQVSVAVNSQTQECLFIGDRTIRGTASDVKQYMAQLFLHGCNSLDLSNLRALLFNISPEFIPSCVEQVDNLLRVYLSDRQEIIFINIGENKSLTFGYSDSRTGKSCSRLFIRPYSAMASGVEELIKVYNTRYYSAFRLDLSNRLINVTANKLKIRLGELCYTCAGSGITVQNQGVLSYGDNPPFICRFVVSQYSYGQRPQFAFGIRLANGLEQNVQLDTRNIKNVEQTSSMAVTDIKKFIKGLGL